MNTITLTQFDVKNAAGLRKMQSELSSNYRASLLQEKNYSLTFAERFLSFMYKPGPRLWISLFVIPMIAAFVIATFAAPFVNFGNVFVVSFVLSAALMMVQVMGLDSAYKTLDFVNDEASRLARIDIQERLTRNFENSTHGVPINMNEVMDTIQYGNNRKVIIYRYPHTDLVQIAL